MSLWGWQKKRPGRPSHTPELCATNDLFKPSSITRRSVDSLGLLLRVQEGIQENILYLSLTSSSQLNPIPTVQFSVSILCTGEKISGWVQGITIVISDKVKPVLGQHDCRLRPYPKNRTEKLWFLGGKTSQKKNPTMSKMKLFRDEENRIPTKFRSQSLYSVSQTRN